MSGNNPAADTLRSALPGLYAGADGERESPLASLTATRAVLDAFGLSTKYSFGQNFLINDDIIAKIISLADVNDTDVVLEVGPGIGTLTYALLSHAATVVSIERDSDLPQVLAETLSRFGGSFRLLEMDALDVCGDDLSAALTHGAPMPNKLVSNLPYEVAATVVLDYFQNLPELQSATVMVQREVADRMAARPGTKQYGAYTVKLALYATPAGRFNVGPKNFFPAPRVESTVQRLNRHIAVDETGKPVDESVLRAACLMADAAFANRRKTIANSCKTFFSGRGLEHADAEALAAIFAAADVSPSVRGEALPPEDFLKLGEAYLKVMECR